MMSQPKWCETNAQAGYFDCGAWGVKAADSSSDPSNGHKQGRRDKSSQTTKPSPAHSKDNESTLRSLNNIPNPSLPPAIKDFAGEFQGFTQDIKTSLELPDIEAKFAMSDSIILILFVALVLVVGGYGYTFLAVKKED